MFPCACSLRSTQCAALIALAAAAGIMRIEPPPAPMAETPARQPIRQSAQIEWGKQRMEVRAATEIFRLQLRSLLELAASCDAFETCSPLPGFVACRACAAAYSVPPAAAPSARQHSFPFAVGPPADGAILDPRAADIEVSGDLAARRSTRFRVAVCFVLLFAALTQRDAHRTTESAGSAFDPSLALRDEPGSFPPRLSSIILAALRGCRADIATLHLRSVQSSERPRASFRVLRSVPRLQPRATGSVPPNAIATTASTVALHRRQANSSFV
jgi:hypothetical protein